MRPCRLLAAKSTLAARVDSMGGDPKGSQGRSYWEEIQRTIEKWQKPSPAKRPKSLPVPCPEPKKKRGGHGLRKMKEGDAMWKLNRIKFGVPDESSWDGMEVGCKMLCQARIRKFCVSVATKVVKTFKGKHNGSTGATYGLMSSLAFTLVKGIELPSPQALTNQLGTGTQNTYFSNILKRSMRT